MIERRSLLALVLIACVQPAAAEPMVTRQTTPSGLVFRHAHMPNDSQQAIGFAWKDGTAIGLPGKEALAVLAPALMMEGPSGSTRSATLEDLRDLQAAMGLSAGSSFAQGSLSAPRAKFAAAAQILARVLADPALPEDKLRQAQRSLALSSQQAEQNAETLGLRLFQRLVLGNGPHWRLSGADPTIYERISKADIEAWRRDVLVREGLMLVAAGPMEAAEIASVLDRVFARLPLTGRLPAASRPVLQATGKLVVLEKAVVQTVIVAGAPTTLSVTPDLVRAELAVEVLGRGSAASRLGRAVRGRLGATYGISAVLQASAAGTRTLLIRTPVANDKAKPALDAIREEYAMFAAEGVTEEEIEPLKTAAITRHQERLRRAPAVASTLIGMALNSFPDDYLATHEARIRSISRAAVNEDIRNSLPKPPLTTVIVAPSADGLGADCVIKAVAEIARCE